MSAKLQAAEAIRRLAIQFQAMTEAADLLETIGEAESATDACARGRAVAEQEFRTVQAHVADATRNLKAAQDEASRVLTDADQRARTVMNQAEEWALQQKADATASIAKMVQDARTDAMEKIALDIADAQADLALLREQVGDAKALLEQTRLQAATSQAQVNAAQVQLTELKKLVGL